MKEILRDLIFGIIMGLLIIWVGISIKNLIKEKGIKLVESFKQGKELLCDEDTIISNKNYKL